MNKHIIKLGDKYFIISGCRQCIYKRDIEPWAIPAGYINTTYEVCTHQDFPDEDRSIEVRDKLFDDKCPLNK